MENPSRTQLLHALREYQQRHANAAALAERIIDAVQAHDGIAVRRHLPGHLTASAFVVSHDGDSVVLLHHAKLDRWIQPGGHADGEFDLQRVAIREVEEECGLSSLAFVNNEIFDIDIHSIPRTNHEPEHLHFDIRYLLQVSEGAVLRSNNESKGVRWVPLKEIEALTSELSVLRMRDKYLSRYHRPTQGVLAAL